MNLNLAPHKKSPEIRRSKLNGRLSMNASKSDAVLQLSNECLQILQNSKGLVSQAVRKLQLVASLIGDNELEIWCQFHLGSHSSKVPRLKKEESQEAFEVRRKQFLNELKNFASVEEILPRLNSGGGGFQSIEKIEGIREHFIRQKVSNDGTTYMYYLLDTINSCRNKTFEKASRFYNQYAFGSIPQEKFDAIRVHVDDLLLDLCPEAIEQFMAAYARLSSTSAEDWSQALTSCRRVIKSVADALYPPKATNEGERKLGEEQYMNRLWAFLDENVPTGSNKTLAKAHVDYLGSFLDQLNSKSSKGVHATVTYEETVRVVLYTYLTLGDVLEFSNKGVQKSLKKVGLLDLNTAPLEELMQSGKLSRQVAKDIIKARSQKKFTSIDELAKIKGVGPVVLERLRKIFLAL